MINFNKSVTISTIKRDLEHFKIISNVRESTPTSRECVELEIEFFYHVQSYRLNDGENVFLFAVSLKSHAHRYSIDINIYFKYDFEKNEIRDVLSNIDLDSAVEQKAFEMNIIYEAIEDGIDQITMTDNESINDADPYYYGDSTKDMMHFKHIKQAFWYAEQNIENFSESLMS